MAATSDKHSAVHNRPRRKCKPTTKMQLCAPKPHRHRHRPAELLANREKLLSSKVSVTRAAIDEPCDSEDIYGGNESIVCLVDFGSTSCTAGWKINTGAATSAPSFVQFPGADGRAFVPTVVQHGQDGTPDAFGWQVNKTKPYCRYFKVAFWGDDPYGISTVDHCHIPQEMSLLKVCTDFMRYVQARVTIEYEIQCPDKKLPLTFVVVAPGSMDKVSRDDFINCCRDGGMNIRAPVIDEHAAAALGALVLSPYTPGEDVLAIDCGGFTTDLQVIRVDRDEKSGRFFAHHMGDPLSLTAGGLCVDQLCAGVVREKNPAISDSELQKVMDRFSTFQKKEWPDHPFWDASVVTLHPTDKELQEHVFDPVHDNITKAVAKALKGLQEQRAEYQKVYVCMQEDAQARLAFLKTTADQEKPERQRAMMEEGSIIEIQRLPAIKKQMERNNGKVRMVLMGGYGQSKSLREHLRKSLEDLQDLNIELVLEPPQEQFRFGVFYGACAAVNDQVRFVTVKATHTYAVWGYHVVEDQNQGEKVYDGYIGALTCPSPNVFWPQDESVVVGQSTYSLGKVSEEGLRQPAFPNLITLKRTRAGPEAHADEWEDVVVLDMRPINRRPKLLATSTSSDTGTDEKTYLVLEYQHHVCIGDTEIVTFSVTDRNGTVLRSGQKVVTDF